jgi:hypothetical protein
MVIRLSCGYLHKQAKNVWHILALLLVGGVETRITEGAVAGVTDLLLNLV